MDPKYRTKQIVWAKIEPYPWWPGKIINIHIQCNEIIYKILFFADPTFAYLQQSQLCSYHHFDPKSNADFPVDLRLLKAIRLADEAHSKIQLAASSKDIKMSLQYRKTEAKSIKQTSLQQPKQRKQNISSNNSNQSQQLPQQSIKSQSNQERPKCQEIVPSMVQQQQAIRDLFLNFEDINKENIIEVLQKRIDNRQKFEYNYENRKKIIQHKIELKKILLQRYNLYQPIELKHSILQPKVKEAACNEGSKGRRLKKIRIHRKKIHTESMTHTKDKCIRRLYNVCKKVLNGQSSTFNIKQFSLNLIKRICQLSQQNQTKYRSLFVTLIKSIESQKICKSKCLNERVANFNAYLDKLQNEKHQDEQGSKMTQISTINH